MSTVKQLPSMYVKTMEILEKLDVYLPDRVRRHDQLAVVVIDQRLPLAVKATYLYSHYHQYQTFLSSCPLTACS